MKKHFNILTLIFAIAFMASCSKMDPLRKKGEFSEVFLKSDTQQGNETGTITDPDNDEEHDLDINITDPDNDEDHDKDVNRKH